jgi:hypothetical protein
MFPDSPVQPPKRHTFRRAFIATFGVITALIVVIVILAVVIASGSKHGGKTAAVAKTSTSAAPAAASPGLNAAQQQFISDMRSKYSFDSSVADSDLVSYGQNVCTSRAQDHQGQGYVESFTRQNWSHTSASDAYNMARTAESDLCPAWLPAKKWHVIASGTLTGMGNSQQFKLHTGSTRLRVTYHYSGNSTGFGGDNYAADLVSSSDDQPLANDIAVAGGHTTFVYPDTSFGGSRTYHLNVSLADSGCVTTFSVSQRY